MVKALRPCEFPFEFDGLGILHHRCEFVEAVLSNASIDISVIAIVANAHNEAFGGVTQLGPLKTNLELEVAGELCCPGSGVVEKEHPSASEEDWRRRRKSIDDSGPSTINRTAGDLVPVSREVGPLLLDAWRNDRSAHENLTNHELLLLDSVVEALLIRRKLKEQRPEDRPETFASDEN